MAATAKVYGLALQSLTNAEINYTTGSAKVMLVGSSYTPNQDTHRYVSSVTGEIAGTGYTAGGQLLASKTVTYTAGTNTLMLDCADPSWSASSFTFRHAVFYIDTGTTTTSPLISWMDFGSDQTATGGTVAITVPSTGIAQLVAA